MAADYYSTLGVSNDASEQEIKKAFRKKAAELHPDRNKDPKATEEFKKVNEAYQVLSDPQKKQMYDQYGSAAFEGGGNPFGQGFGGNGQQFQVDFSDLFGEGLDSIFGDSPFGDIFGGGRNTRSRNKGQDLQVSIQILMSDVITGPEKEIVFKKKDKCSHCSGTGGDKVQECRTCKGVGRVNEISRTILGNVQVSKECSVCHGTGKEILEKCKVCNGESVVDIEKKLKIRIPSGIEDGMNLRFTGEGDAGKFSAPNGDLFIEVRVKDEYGFKRVGDNLVKSIELPVYSLVLGEKVQVQTFEGTKTIDIAKGTQVTDKIILKSQGVPNLRSKKRGDLVFEIQLKIPKKLSRQEEDVYKQLKDLDN